MAGGGLSQHRQIVPDQVMAQHTSGPFSQPGEFLHGAGAVAGTGEGPLPQHGPDLENSPQVGNLQVQQQGTPAQGFKLPSLLWLAVCCHLKH